MDWLTDFQKKEGFWACSLFVILNPLMPKTTIQFIVLTRFIAHLREGLSIPFVLIIFAYTFIENIICTYIRVCHIFLKAQNSEPFAPNERQVCVGTTEI